MAALLEFVTLAGFVVGSILHIGFAFAIARDSGTLSKTMLVGRFLWTLAGLALGVIGGTIYWLLHHSTLVPEDDRPRRVATRHMPPIEPEYPGQG